MMKRLLCFLVLSLMAVAQAGPRAGIGPTIANLWIDTNGGTCTRQGTAGAYVDAQACASMQAALTASAGGDVIVMKNGTYGAQTITTGGKASAVSFYAETNNSVLIGHLDVQVDRVHITGVIESGTGDNRFGGWIHEPGNTEFQDVILSDWRGAMLSVNASNTTVQYAEIGGANVCTMIEGVGWEDAVRFYARTSVSTPTAQNDKLLHTIIHDFIAPNSCTALHVDGMQLNGGNGIVIDGNVIYNNESSAIQQGVFNGTTLGSMLVQNNYFGAPRVFGNVLSIGQATCGGVIVQNNTFGADASAVNNSASCSGGAPTERNNIWLGHIGNCNVGTAFAGDHNTFIDSSTCGTTPKICTPTFASGLTPSGSNSDIRLSSADTCAKDASGSSFPATDFYGNPRPQGAGADAGAFEIVQSSACGNTLNWTTPACQIIAGTQQLSTAMVRSGGNWVNDPNAWSVISRHGEYMQSETECNIPSALQVTAGSLGITTSSASTGYVCADYNATSGVQRQVSTGCSSATVFTAATSSCNLSGDLQWNTFNFKYGTVIVRQKLFSKTTKLWAGEWLLGINCQAPNKYTGDTGQAYTGACTSLNAAGYDEIDILETKANDDASNGGNCWGNSWYVLNGTADGPVTCWNSATRTLVADTASYHKYAMNWCQNGVGAGCAFSGIRETVDGIDTGVVHAPPTLQNMFLILQTQTSTDVTGAPVGLPQTLNIDYVKVCDASITAVACDAAATDGSNTGVIFFDDFQSVAVSAPTVTTTTATSITTTTASSGGTVTATGGASITSEGVCYATTVNPTTPCTSNGTSTPFTSALSGLSVNTLYHYRAFATNSVGTSYGSDLTFTTLNTAFTISGTVSTAAGSTNPNPFSVSCPACSPTTATTTSGGVYSFANQASGGNYVITPSVATYTFSPGSATFNNLAANQTANFTATGTATASLQIPAAFPNQGVGITSSPRTPSLSNTGTAALSITSVSIVGTNPGDFSISNNACGATLAASTSCIISVTFTPTVVGLRQATLQTVDSVGTQTAPLSGTGFQAPIPSCTPTGGDYKSGRMISCSNAVPLATMCFQMATPPTTNGAGTCTSGTTYQAPFMVTTSGTLFVTGTQSGNTDNSTSYVFTITPTWTTGWVMNLSGGSTTFGPVLVAGTCGPPTYACVSRSTASLGTITSSVDTTTPFNTTWHSAINPSTNCYTLLADSNLTGIAKNTSSNQTLTLIAGGNNTWSLGANDHMGSVNNTFWGIGRNGGAYIYHFAISNVGGSTCVQNISPFGGQGAGLWLGGSVTFSTTTDNVAYHLPNGTGNHILTKEVLNSDASNSVSSTAFDFDTCPGMTPGTNYQATTQLGIAVGDTRFATALSPGNQGFGKDILVYEPGVGCHHWDTATGDIWLPTDVSSASLHETACFTPDYATGSGIHGTQIGGNGKVVQISGACWVGFGGAAIGGSNVAYWEVGTANVIGIKDQPPNDYLSTNTALNRGTFSIAGHDSMSAFHTMVGHNPTPNSRVVFPFNETNMRNFTTLFDFGGGPDSHGGHPLLDLADTYPWIWGSMGTLGTIYNQEVYGIGPNPGPPIRFGPLYNTGTNGGPGCGDSILAISQDGRMIVFMTDMLGAIPTCAPVAMVLGN